MDLKDVSERDDSTTTSSAGDDDATEEIGTNPTSSNRRVLLY
jgi:hypothetical protein